MKSEVIDIAGSAHSQRTRSSDETISFERLLRTIWLGKFVVFFCTVLMMITGAYYAFAIAVPIYRATAVVMLETQQEQVVDLQSVMSGLSPDSTVINSEIQVLQGRELIGQVVDRLALTEDPEFNVGLQETGALTEVINSVRDGLTDFFTTPRSDDELGINASETEERQSDRVRESTITALLANLSVNVIPVSLVFQITVQSEDPDKAALIANTIVEEYINNQLTAKFEATEQASAWLSGRVAELQAELEEAEAQVQDFNSQIDLVSRESLLALERQLKELRDRLASERAALEENVARLAAMQAADTRQEKAAASQDPQIIGMLERSNDGSSTVNVFDQRFVDVMQRLQRDVPRSRSQIAALEKSETVLSHQIEQQNADLITLQQLTREAEATRLLYEYFLTRLKETSAQQGVQQPDSRGLSRAIAANAPFAPKKTQILAGTALLGILLGSALVLLRELRRNTFRTARDMESHLQYTVMGQVPLVKKRRRKDVLECFSYTSTSAEAEAIRNLRTSILLSNVDAPPQVIQTVSALPGEGKTTISFALALNLSSLGKRVLLIEGDIRRQIFKQYMLSENKSGLISVLSGKANLKDAALHDEKFGFDVLLGDEQSRINATDLFSSARFAEMMQEARQNYDHIIIDTAPVLIVPDSRVIAKYSDALLFVVAWDRTLRAQVEEALRMFEMDGRSITGIVLNQISSKGMRRYGYGGKYGAYGEYGKKYYSQ